MIPSRRTGTLALAALLLVSALSTIAAQPDSRSSAPAFVVDSFSIAVRDARWNDAARFVDLESAARLRDETLAQLRSSRMRRSVTADEFMRADPDMPREVAEYQARQAATQTTDFDMLQFTYARVASAEELARLTSLEAAARYVEARDQRWMIRLSMERERRRGCNIPDSALVFIEKMRPNDIRVVGSVIDDSVAYVLHKELPPPEDSARIRRRTARAAAAGRRLYVEPPRLTTLRLTAGEWRILPDLEWGGSAFVGAQCAARSLGTPASPPPSSP
jgi:hypothetical protein